MVATWVDNALFFGAALLVLLLVSFVVSRQAGRVLELGLYAADRSERAALREIVGKRAARVVGLLTALLGLGLVGACVVLSMYAVDVPPRAWAWFQATIGLDRAALAWLLAELLGLVVVAVYLRGALRLLSRLVVARMRRDPALAQHGEQLGELERRVDALLRWGVMIAAVTAAGFVLGLHAGFTDALLVVTYIVCGVLVARALAAIADLGVDIAVQLVRALEDRPSALRYVGRLGRLEHLARITKRTLEYFCFIGAATFVVERLSPDTWLAHTGLLAIRLIALVYVGRVAIEVCGLVLREVLLADPEKRSEAENQQRLTLVPVASSVLRYAVYFCITVMALQEIGVDTSPILAGAGLLGLAVGLGAQTFVGDVVSGFFILFEGLFLVGDRVRVGEVIGNVEEIGVRVLKVRDEFGVLHCIPNGEVRSVANHARDYVNAVVDFAVPYDEDLPGVLADLAAHVGGLRPGCADMLADPEFVVQELLDAAVRIRCLVRVKPSRDDAVAELVRGEVLTALTARGVAPRTCQVVRLLDGAGARRGSGASPVAVTPGR